MFDYIHGELVESSITKAIVETAGIGYAVHIPLSTYNKLPSTGTKITLYLFQVIREDAHTLYGFLTRDERDFFISLCAVSGIGPKTALALIGHLEASDLYMAISQSQVSLLCKIPGVGKKTAERLVVELRDRIKAPESKIFSGGLTTGAGSAVNDATSALIHLGYNALQAQKAVRAVLASRNDPPPIAELITLALRQI